MQLTFINKEKKRLQFGSGELSDEIHIQVSFPVTWKWDVVIDQAIED